MGLRGTLTIGQAAFRLGVHRTTILRWIAEGLLHCQQPRAGKHRRFTLADLDACALANAERRAA